MLDRLFLLGFILLFFLIFSCRRDGYYEGKDVQITFSKDTLRFDTVFTSLGSSTRFIKIFNPKTEPILISVTLKNQTNSFFRINADGAKGPVINNLEINGRDSIYVFVEVTIDPNLPLNVSPFIIEDQIEVSVNGNIAIAYLEAWGQNANYIPSNKSGGTSSILKANFAEVIWDDPKPYVIYGVLYIDSCTLVLPAGSRIYVHGGVVRNENSIYNDGLLVFLKDGKLKSLGTIDSPVIFQGDRLEEEYKDVKSQWVGLLFWQESKNNVLSHTTIKNSIIGLRADSLADVKLSGCQISNTGSAGIIGRHASIYGENCLLFNNGSYGIQLTYGGNYLFNYCTVGSYEGQDEAVILTDFYCEDILCCSLNGCLKLNQLNATFNNCIFTGASFDEVGLNQASENNSDFNFIFNNCAFRVNDLLDPKNTPDFFDHCNDCINLKANDRLFLNINKDDYRLDTLSVVLGKGKYLPSVLTDIIGKIRKPVPDIGCFEL